MATGLQITANRLNAGRSSGPKSERGRRAAALNALRHGLSAPLIPAEHEHSVAAIADLIEGECGGGASARDLAIKILDYERNVEQQRRWVAAMLAPPEPALRGAALERATLEAFPEYNLCSDCLQEERLLGLPVSRRDLADVAGMKREMQRFVLAAQAKSRANKSRGARNSLRYLKRSGNQLVKAIRALAARP